MNHNDNRSSETLRALLEELYVIDPTMREHEDIIRKILVEFLATSPDIKLDPTFVTRLRTKITEQARVLAHERTPNHSSFWNVLAVYRLPLGSALLVLLLVLPFAYSRFGDSPSPTIPLFTNQIATLEKNAFGTLTPGSPSQGVSPQRAPLGMGGGSSTESAPSGLQKDTARIMPYPLPPDQIVHYQFHYNGDPITLEESELPVYRTRKDMSSGKTFFDLVRSTSIGSFALNKLQNAFVHNITISEDRPRGYTLYLDFENQSFSMNMNWASWPHLMRPQDSSTQTPPPSLSDTEITGIIEAFAQEYNIDLTGYGTPHIMRNEPVAYAEEKMVAYISEEVTVVYPIVIEGTTVIDEGGNETGLYINVNLRERAVSSLGTLQAPSYESTTYAVEQSQETILEALRRRQGVYGTIDTNSGKTVTVTLGTPTRSLMRTWHYDAANNTSRELFVPALTFPVQGVSDSTMYYQKQIVIPIVKDLLNEYMKAPQPMPLDAEVRTLPAPAAESKPVK